MAYADWLIYALAVLVLTATPGPSVLLCVSKSVSSGFYSAMASAVGSLTAIVIIMTLSFTGLGMVLATSDATFTVIKWAGAAYLVYLGIKALTSKQQSFELSKTKPSGRAWLSHTWSGFVVGASNPKAIVFFTSLFPQFIQSDQALFPQYVVMASTFAVMELFWLACYSAVGSRSSRWLLKHGRARRFNQVTGGLFVSAGLLLTTTSRASTA